MREIDVLILRHGETDENARGIVQGQLNTLLNERGRSQAQLVAFALKDVKFTHAYTSDLSRASETARIILQYHPNVQLIESAGIRERNLGTRQGKKGEKKNSSVAERATAEPIETLHARLREWWHTAVLQHCDTEVISSLLPSSSPTSPPSSSEGIERPMILVVSHGASISELVKGILLKEYKYNLGPDIPDLNGRKLPNTSITEIQFRFAKTTDESDAAGNEQVALVPWITRYGDISHMLTEPQSKREMPAERANVDAEESEQAEVEAGQQEREDQVASTSTGTSR